MACCRISSSLDIGLKLSAVTFSTTLSGISATCWPWTLKLLSMAHASVGDNLQLMLQKTWMVAVFRHTLDIGHVFFLVAISSLQVLHQQCIGLDKLDDDFAVAPSALMWVPVWKLLEG